MSFLRGVKRTTEQPQISAVISQSSCKFSLFISLLLFCYGEKKKKKQNLQNCLQTKRKGEKPIVNGGLKSESTSKSVLHYFSRVGITQQNSQSLRHTVGKLKLLLRVVYGSTFPHPHPPSRNLESCSAVVSFQRSDIFTVNCLVLE